jgi:hypothetical protein
VHEVELEVVVGVAEIMDVLELVDFGVCELDSV